jgi:NADPH-dependent curcumin reductase CurA
MAATNKQVLLAERPRGAVAESHFKIVESAVPQPGAGELLVRNLYLSLDPYMRGRMDDAKSYAPSVQIGEVMVGGTVGEVIASDNPRFKVGDFVEDRLGWQQYAVATGKGMRKVDPDYVPLPAYLGAVGMPGVTAWIGLNEHGRPKAGETVVVSAASGAVGGIVGQLAKMKDCRAVGIAGGRAKCDYVVNELGFDACVDYKGGNLHADLKAAAPAGVDVYFDNVGGPVLDTTLRLMNPFSRIPLCGLISGYSDPDALLVKNFRSFLVNRISLRGFICFDHRELWKPAYEELGRLVHEGKLKYRESVASGLESAPRAFIGLLKGENFGKQIVKLD